MKRDDIIKKVTDLVTAKMLEANCLPWDKGIIKSFIPGCGPISWSSKKPYSGLNCLLLAMLKNIDGEYATFQTIKKAGGKVKKGEKSTPILLFKFWNKAEKRTAENGDDKKDIIPILQMYNVFDVLTQCEGLQSRREGSKVPEVVTNDFIDTAIDTFAKSTDLTITYTATDCASYSPAFHRVQLFRPEVHKTLNSYYSTTFHELIHSTSKGLKRPLGLGFGSEKYSAEEVIAETGSMMLCNYFNIAGDKEQENSAVYVKSWSRKLQDNPDWLVNGIGKACKAVEYFLENAACKAME